MGRFLDKRWPLLALSSGQQGDENTVVTRIDPASGAIAELTPSRGVKAAVVAMSRDAPQDRGRDE